jgi:hypothetical protein
MKINLNNCVAGDKVITRDGRSGVYLDRLSKANDRFPHRVEITENDGDSMQLTFTDEGMFQLGEKPCDTDIVTLLNKGVASISKDQQTCVLDDGTQLKFRDAEMGSCCRNCHLDAGYDCHHMPCSPWGRDDHKNGYWAKMSDSRSIGYLAEDIGTATLRYHGADLIRVVANLINSHPAEVNSCIGDVPEA